MQNKKIATLDEKLDFLRLQLNNRQLLAVLKAARQNNEKKGIECQLKFPIQACEYSAFLSLNGLIEALEITINEEGE